MKTIDINGIALATKMLAELEADSAVLSDACSMNAEYRDRDGPRDQRNIVLEYFTLTRSPEERAAFAAVLSDFIASSLGGFVPSASSYAKEAAK